MSLELTVEGMSCGHCEQTVEEAVGELAGVEGVSANNQTGEVVVDGSPDADEVVDAIQNAGYRAEA